LVAIVETAIYGHLSDLELRKYSSTPTSDFALLHMPIIIITAKYASIIAKSRIIFLYVLSRWVYALI